MNTEIKNIVTDSFSVFYNKYQSSLQKFVAYRIPDPNDAEDLTQDIFMRVLERWQFVREDTAESFLYTIARNCITDTLRRYYKKEEVHSYLYDVMITSTNKTEEEVLVNDFLALTKERISRLPLKRKTAYRMKYEQNLSITEIATSMQLTNKTVETHIQYARNAIKSYLREILNVG